MLIKDNEHIQTMLKRTLDMQQPYIMHVAKTPAGSQMIANAVTYLERLRKYGFVPGIEGHGSDNTELCVQYIEEKIPETLEDKRSLIINMARILYILRKNKIEHGDLTRSNILIYNNMPFIIDWFEASVLGENKKRPEGDAYHLFRALLEPSGDPSRVLERWIAMREYLPDHRNGYFLDLGAYRGDMCYMAAAEGFKCHAVDIRNDLYEEDEIGVTFHFGHSMNEFVYDVIPFFSEKYGENPTVICMQSAYPYLRKQCDHPSEAAYVISRCIAESEVFFFETQLYGDGPGPEFLKTDEDVIAFLEKCASHPTVTSRKNSTTIDKVVTVEVEGRNARRTTFAVS